jgi:hypothetical protein
MVNKLYKKAGIFSTAGTSLPEKSDLLALNRVEILSKTSKISLVPFRSKIVTLNI